MPLVLIAALNAPSTADAADRCVRFGPAGARGAQALVVARPGVDVRQAVLRGAQDGKGPVAVRPSPRPCALTFVVADGELVVPGWSGTIRSDSTRLDGVVAAADVADAVRGADVLHPGGRTNLPRLEERLDRTHHQRIRVRIGLAAILIALAVAAPRRAIVAGPAAIAAALVLSAFGSTSVVLFVLLTLLGTLAPLRALWLFFAAYLVVLVASPETQSLALLGPHPEAGGRFYGLTNELETLLLAPALVLGLAAAPLVILLVAWSRAGADGGGAVVFLGAYAVLALGLSARRLTVAAGIAVAAALALVGIDAATGGSSHVTKTVGDGPDAVWDAVTHRWSVAWHGATATPGRALLNLVLLAGLVWVAAQRPRHRVLDAFLVGVAVSLAVNDTPQDVLLWGALQGVALRRSL